MMRALSLAVLILLPLCSGCSGRQSALDAGRQRGRTDRIAVLDLHHHGQCGVDSGDDRPSPWRCGRRHEAAEPLPEPLAPDRRVEHRATITINALVIATGVILLALMVASFLAGRSGPSLAREHSLELELTGRQWRWDIRYADKDPARVVTDGKRDPSAGWPRGRAQACLHRRDPQLLVPNIAGKLISFQAARTSSSSSPNGSAPIAANVPILRPAARPYGAPRGGRARAAIRGLVCGRARFGRRARHAEAKRGKELFSKAACVMCHQIRGSTAGARLGPDLTHVGRRATIAAGTLPMTAVDLDSWIADPQADEARSFHAEGRSQPGGSPQHRCLSREPEIMMSITADTRDTGLDDARLHRILAWTWRTERGLIGRCRASITR
jgi:cytochrome c oxidase subunit 2